MIQARTMSEEPPITKLKLMIVGHEKNGKSLLASTGRKPILFHDHDNRAEALNGRPGVYVNSYIDPQWPNQPEAASDQLDILDQLENNLDLSQLKHKGKKIFPNASENTILRTNVIDSLVTLGRNTQAYALYGTPGIRREIPVGKMKVHLPAGWDAWNAEMKSVEPMILRFLALPTDTIVILHEDAEQAPDSTAEAPRYTGRVSVYPHRYQMLVKYFNELWRVKLTQVGGLYVPRVYARPSYEFDSASAMFLDDKEEPNIEAMFAKHEARVKQGYKLGQVSPAQLPAKVIL